jgi:quercetin dioxygenase-like cupin family protein
MKLHDWQQIPREQLNPLVTRQLLHGDTMTIAYIYLQSGAVVGRHSHINEQVTNLLSGRLKFVFDDGETTIATGQSLQIPSNVPHRVEALEDSVALDVFSPVREDWIRGEDAYLRGT